MSDPVAGISPATSEAEPPTAQREAAGYRALFVDSPRPMWVYEPGSLRFLAVNQAAVRAYGYSEAEFLELSILDLLVVGEKANGPRTLDEAEAVVRSVPLLGRVDGLRRTQRRKDGSLIEVELAGNSIVFDGQPARVVHILDVTERVRTEREVVRLVRAQRMLSACNEALIRATDEQQLLQRVCDIAVEIGGYLVAWVGFAEQDAAKSIRPAAHAGERGQAVIRQAPQASWDGAAPNGDNAAGRAIRSGEIGVIPDVRLSSGYPRWRQFAEEVGHKGVIGLPLKRQGESIGALCLYAPDTLNISADELALLQELANDLAFGIDNLRALDQQRRLQEAVLKVGAAVSRQGGEQFFRDLTAGLVDAVGAQAGHVARLLPGTPSRARTLFALIDGEPVEPFDFKLEYTPCPDFRERDSWLLDAHAALSFPNSPFLSRVAAESCVIRRLDNSEGEPVGLLTVLFRKPLEDAGFVDSVLRIFAARAASELERQQSDARIRSQASLLDQAQDAIAVRDLEGRIIYWNQGCERVYGWRAAEVLGRTITSDVYVDPSVFESLHAQVLRDGRCEGELVQRRKDGSSVRVETRWTLVHDDQGRPEAVLAINTDVTRRKAAEDAVHKLAFYDSLTGLPNRQQLNVALHRARQASAASGLAGALLFVNLDNFKAVNETLGHAKGDLLLRLAAERIVGAAGPQDTVARIGGDEFLVLLSPVHAQLDAALAHAADVSERLVQSFAAPIPLEDFEHLATACVGIAAFQGEEGEDGELLKQVDLALYQAKAAGRGVIRFYDPRLQLAVAERATLEAELRQALPHGELELYYQPQVHRDGRLIGLEALLRWKHPRRGMVSPAVFIPVAEESGLILAIGQWVIETACRQLAQWQRSAETAELALSVNVSASQFRHDDFVEQVARAAREAGLRPGSLKLELTESLLVYDMEAIIEKMQLLKANGLGLSLDDFGTGYSSLSYLKRMPLDQLKIDQSFVRDIMTDPNDAAIAKTVIGLAHSLGLTVIAEGVEQREQRDFLFEHGCDAYQGYLLSRPLPLKELQTFLGRTPDAAQPAAPRAEVAPPQSPQDYAATLQSVTEAIPAMIAVNGPDERYRFVNRAFERWFGVSRTDMVGRTSLQVLGQAEYDRSAPWIRRAMGGETVSFEKAFPSRQPPVHIAVSFIPLRTPAGESDGYVTVAQDVTHHHEEAVRLHQLSERDPLTGLLNRRGFENYLDQAVASGAAATIGLLYVDLDHFKPVNDQHGHPVGDQLLREFGQRLRAAVRPNDAVARLGGDEFAVVLAGVPSQAQCVHVADEILAMAKVPFEIGELRLGIGASVGIAFDASGMDGIAGLVRRADSMLYQAKAAGRGRWV